MLTDEQIDAVIRTEPAAVYELLQTDGTAASIQEALRFIARTVEREAYRRAAAECRRLGNAPIWIASAYHCAEAIEALGREE
jgi:hypothetical protein